MTLYQDTLTVEQTIVRMAKAIKPLDDKELTDPTARVAKYIAADIPTECIRDFDREAVGRAKLYRDKIDNRKSVVALVALAIGSYAALSCDPTQAATRDFAAYATPGIGIAVGWCALLLAFCVAVTIRAIRSSAAIRRNDEAERDRDAADTQWQCRELNRRRMPVSYAELSQ
jgi:hypothetical protein